jgi:[ribosomal protein S18]-alanine N-acetyltransferase
MADAAPATRLSVRPLQRQDAEEIASWRYEGPWSIYDSRPGDPLLSADAGYLAVVDGAGSLVGFLCTGQEARVPGLAAQEGIVDIGVGMRPDLVGRGLGSAFGAVVLGYIRDMCGDRPLRAVVQSWNERSLRLTSRLGFGVAGTHRCQQDGREVSYTILVRPQQGQTADRS